MDLLLHNLRTIGTHHCDQTVGEEAAREIERLRELLERAATEADNACAGWNDALMHEGARKAGDAVRRLLVPNK